MKPPKKTNSHTCHNKNILLFKHWGDKRATPQKAYKLDLSGNREIPKRGVNLGLIGGGNISLGADW